MLKKILATTLILIITIYALTSCSSSAVKLTHLGDGGIRDESTGRVYYHCSLSVGTIELMPEPYGKGKNKFALHEIKDMPTSDWLSEKSDIPFVYREQSIPEPDLHAMSVTRAVITETQINTIRLGEITDSALLEEILTMLRESEQVEFPSAVDQVFTISFLSEEYPGLLYNVQFVEGTNGKTYLRDRGAGICVDGRGIIYDTDEQDTAEEDSEI